MIDIYEWDIRRFALQGKGQRLLRYTDYLLENITQQVFERQGLGMNVTQFKVLGNADGFNLIEHGCPLCKKKTKQIKSSYHYYRKVVHQNNEQSNATLLLTFYENL